MNEQNTMATSAMNEYGFQAYTFPAEMEERGELQRIDLDFCKYAQATGSNYIETCKRVAAMHAKLARAGRYGGGQWTAWCKARGLSEGSARRMVTIGDNFNSANLAELKIFHRRLPHTCVVGCGGLVVGLERNPPHIYERIFDCLLHLSVFVVSVVGFAGKVVHGKNKKIKLYKGFLFCRQTHHNPPHRSLRNI